MTAKNYSDVYARYSITRQTRLRQSGKNKGEEYIIKKFFDNKEKKFVKHQDVLNAAKIHYVKPSYKIKGSQIPTTKKITYTFEVKGYKRKRDSAYGKKGSIAPVFENYRQRVISTVKSDVEAFEYKRDAGRNGLPPDVLYRDGDRTKAFYGNVELKLIKTTFE